MCYRAQAQEIKDGCFGQYETILSASSWMFEPCCKLVHMRYTEISLTVYDTSSVIQFILLLVHLQEPLISSFAEISDTSRTYASLFASLTCAVLQFARQHRQPHCVLSNFLPHTVPRESGCPFAFQCALKFEGATRFIGGKIRIRLGAENAFFGLSVSVVVHPTSLPS